MSPPKTITILLAEDHTIMRQGLASLLNADGHFAIIGGAKTGREAVAMALDLKPDIILMDIAMPVLNGLEATRQILAAMPNAKVIILSAYSDDEYVERMIGAGVAGFLEKQTSAEILTKGILEVIKGNKFFSPSIAKRQRDLERKQGELPKGRRPPLTSREAQVLQMVAEGSTNKGISIDLGISIKTVEKHRQHLMAKLAIHDTAGLTRYAIATGAIESSVQLTIV